MKQIKQKNKYLKYFGIIVLLAIVSFTIYQSTLVQEDKQNIIGTWLIDNENTSKWEFTSGNKCNWKFEGNIISEFTYTIESEFTSNNVEHTFLTLTSLTNQILNVGEKAKYAINGLGNDKMTLETLPPKIDYIHFTKE